MYVHEGITLTKKTKCKTDKNHRHKSSLLLICTEPIAHYVAITQKSITLYNIEKDQMFHH